MNLIQLSIPIFFLLIGIEIIIDRLQKSNLYRFNDSMTNINCGLLSQITAVFTKVVLVVFYVGIYENVRLIEAIPQTWWMYVILFIGVDFFYYWFHRYAHEISLFWGTHIVHHQSEDYNLSVALRQSSLQAFVSTFFYLPLAFIGFHPVAFITVSALQTLYQFWIHTKTIDKMPAAFEYVFNTPSHHRVHHGRNPKYIDKNHGGTLIIFDRMFGTFQAEEETVVYGVTKSTNSWNPVWVNFDYYADLWRASRQMPRFWDKLKLLFMRPGWQPQSMGGSLQVPQPKAGEAVRFNPQIPAGLDYYIFANFLIITIGSTYFLFLNSQIPFLQSLAWAVLLAFSLVCISFLLEYKKIGFYIELSRLLLVPFLLFFLLPSSVSSLYFVLPLALLNLLFAIWLFRFVPKPQNSPIHLPRKS